MTGADVGRRGHRTGCVGLGGGLFYVSDVLCEVPSNLAVERAVTRLRIARIMISWGLVSELMVVWGCGSDRMRERVWQTALRSALLAGSLCAALPTGTLLPTMVLLCLAMTATCAVKGPFWALSTEWPAAGVVAVLATGWGSPARPRA